MASARCIQSMLPRTWSARAILLGLGHRLQRQAGGRSRVQDVEDEALGLEPLLRYGPELIV